MSGRLIGGPNEETKKLGRREGGAHKPQEDDFRKVTGNLRFPLDFTYHGCPGLCAPVYPGAFRTSPLASQGGFEIKDQTY